MHGRHELKFGGGYQHLQINALQGIATNGFYVFAGFPVVPDAFASFLFGIRGNTVCNYSSTGLITGIANSSYNALGASLKKRFSHGISFLASYTYSKSIDDSSTFNLTGSASKPLAGSPGQLAGQRNRDCDDWHAVYRFRRERFFAAGLGAGNQRIFLQPAEPGRGTESQRRT